MNHFDYRRGTLHAEDVPVPWLVERFGSPLYIYAAATLRRHFRVMDEALRGVDHLICYSVKALSNIWVLRLLRDLGSGFDIVSGGELHRAQLAGADPRTVVYSGVGKLREDISAALHAGILCFNVESAEELDALEAVAAAEGRVAPMAIRINPDVDPDTHPYVATGLAESKFGMPAAEAPKLYRRAHLSRHLHVVGVDCHIGSQLTRVEPFCDALDRVLDLVGALRAEGMDVALVDLGGGLGIPYLDESPPSPSEYAAAIRRRVAGTGLRLLVEPGRVVAGNAGILVTKVLYRKSNGPRSFIVVDAGMNDLIRPSLYGAEHGIAPVTEHAGRPEVVADVVGPICETGDFLARDRALPWPKPGELLAVMSAGAYGFAMASQYNSRPRPAEVLVEGSSVRLIRRRESVADLVQAEVDAPPAETIP